MRRLTARLPDKIAAQLKMRAEQMFGRPRNAASWFICYTIMYAENQIGKNATPEQRAAVGSQIKKMIVQMFEEETRENQ